MERPSPGAGSWTASSRPAQPASRASSSRQRERRQAGGVGMPKAPGQWVSSYISLCQGPGEAAKASAKGDAGGRGRVSRGWKKAPVVPILWEPHHEQGAVMSFQGEQHPGVQTPTADSAGFRLNHTMLRVKDPEKALAFYSRVFGMSVLRRLDFEEMRFSLYFLAKLEEGERVPDDEGERTVWTFGQKGLLELTHNWGTENQIGRASCRERVEIWVVGMTLKRYSTLEW